MSDIASNPPLDAALDAAQAAPILHVTERWLADDAAKDRPKIPVFKLGKKTRRYHLRTIYAKLAADEGVPLEVIAASYGMNQQQQENQ